MAEPPFTLGIEEEYLVVRPGDLSLAAMPEAMLAEAKDALGDAVSPEFRDCMIEIGTPVCANVAEARQELGRLRAELLGIAEGHGLTLLAASCHPVEGPEGRGTGPNARYDEIAEDIGAIADRMMTCGMHLHVGLGEDDALRIRSMRMGRALAPVVLALSASSPFWKGRDTRLSSWRLSVFDAMPRSGPPPAYHSWAHYAESVDALTRNGIIEDSSKIWWDLRPSMRYPTLEWRIMDVLPRMENVLAVTALIQCAMRRLWRLRRAGLEPRPLPELLLAENRWAAQRRGCAASLIEPGTRDLRPLPEIVSELVDEMAEDAAALGCAAELARCGEIAREGSSADRQRAAHRAALDDAADEDGALGAVLAMLRDEFREGLPLAGDAAAA